MVYHDIATRAQALTLKLIVQLDNKEIEAITGLKARTINNIANRALERGFDPKGCRPVILDEHVCDAPKTGRPSKQSENKDTVLEKVRKSRFGREMTCAYISAELGNTISPMTVWRILRAAGMKKTKPTRKPGLTEKMKRDRFEFCLRYE
jgi:transposase